MAINNKTFEHAGLIFTEPWELMKEIMLNIMQSFKFDFLEKEFLAGKGLRFKFHSQNYTLFFHGIFLNV